MRRAKVGYATFYKNFEDKQQCYLELLDAAYGVTFHRVQRAYDREQEWPDKVAAGLGALFEQHRRPPQRRPRLPGRGADRGPRGGRPPRGAC